MIEDRLAYCTTLIKKIEEVVNGISDIKVDNTVSYYCPLTAQFKRLRVELTKELKKLDDDLYNFEEWNRFKDRRIK